ncbi:MAG: alpha/beta hydrolase [Alphaproteobacteria bacterium]|nr:alpha/beta hydrolase [Alphaproteobacteria bacterium]
MQIQLRLLATAVALWSALSLAVAAPITFRDLLSMPRATPTKIVTYGSASHQIAELWLPEGKGPHRTLVMIHGGCWLAELPGTDLMAYISQDLRQHGYAVWSIDYRRIGEDGGGYPGTFTDTADAIDKLKEVAPVHNLDLRKLVAIGHSAGGHLATWSAARPRLPKTSDLANPNPQPITGVVSLAGINDLKAYRETGPTACGGPPTIDALTAAERKDVDLFADTSPAALLPIGVRQSVISGALDKIVPPAFGKDYAAAAAKKGDTVKEITIENAGHFELIDPRSDAWKTIRAEIDALMK